MQVNKQIDGMFYSHAAASYGHMGLLSYLLYIGSDPNIQDEDQDTPLHVCESVDCAKILIEHSADTTIRNRDGQSVSCYRLSCCSCVQYLISSPLRVCFMT
jgi:ankyrin repeat protein